MVGWRGGAVGALTAVLAGAAHGTASGAGPGGSGIGLLLVLAVGLGAVVDASPRAVGPVRLVGLLAAGQLAGHLVLAAGAHHGHPADPGSLPGTLMLGAHIAAVLAGGILLAVADRFARALSRAVRACTRIVLRAKDFPARTVLPVADHPLHRRVLIAASISHRGPPPLPAR